MVLGKENSGYFRLGMGPIIGPIIGPRERQKIPCHIKPPVKSAKSKTIFLIIINIESQ